MEPNDDARRPDQLYEPSDGISDASEDPRPVALDTGAAPAVDESTPLSEEAPDAGDADLGDAEPREAEPPGEEPPSPEELVRRLEAEGDIAADYLEGLLDITDTDGDIDLDVEGDRATVALSGPRLGRFVGAQGETLEALQELCRLAVQQRTGTRSRLMLDVGGYRSRKRTELTALGRQVAEQVAASGEPRHLEPMSAFDRKMVHDGVAAVAGVVSESEGEEPARRIVIRPASAPGSG